MNQFWIKALPPFIRTRLEGRVHLQRILANIGWLFADRFLRLGVGLVVGAWVARYLGPEQFGLYSYVIAFVGLFGLLATLGLDNIVVRDLVRTPENADEILGTALILKMLGALLTIILTIAVIPFLRPGDRSIQGLVGIVAAGTLFQAFDTIDFWFQAQVQSKYTVYARNVAFILISLVKIVLIQLRAPLLAFAAAGLAEIILGALGLVTAYHLTGHSLTRWRSHIARARSLLKSGWPLILSGLAIWIYMRIDQLMLGSMTNDRTIGIYAVAVRLSEIWYFIPIAIVSSVFPAIIASKSQRENLYYERLQRLFNLMVALSYAIIIPTSLLANFIVISLYGPAYAEAGVMFVFLMWAGLFVALGVARESWTVTEGLMRFSFVTTVVGAITNVVLNLIFIPRYGALAAAVATLAAQGVAVSLSTLFYARTRRIFTMQMKALLLWRGVRV
jgi:PST family polysaccharide transporter